MKNLKDIDLRFDLDFKGVPLKAALKAAHVDDLKLVKCIGADGKPGWGFAGTIDRDDAPGCSSSR